MYYASLLNAEGMAGASDFIPDEPATHLTSEKFSTMGSVDEILRRRDEAKKRANQQPSSRDGVRMNQSYFVESLRDMCAKTIAMNFERRPIDFEKEIKNDFLRKKVQSQLSVRIPLQVSVEKIHEDAYWRRCCEMRWTDGQIGSFLRSDTQSMLKSDTVNKQQGEQSSSDVQTDTFSIPSTQISSTTTSISDLVPQPHATSWKQLYLEQNLQEFLESIQSELSIAQELHVLNSQPEKDESGHVSSDLLRDFQTETDRMRNALEEQKYKVREQSEKKNSKKKRKKKPAATEGAEDISTSQDGLPPGDNDTETPDKDLKKNESSASVFDTPDKLSSAMANGLGNGFPSTDQLLSLAEEDMVFATTDPATYELHSHCMKPNLNYYLLHTDRDKLPTQRFREKLMDLFDGSESINNSRLTNLSNDDDIFTFYDNAIYRSYYKTFNHKSQYAFKNIQYWLLAKKDKVDNDPEVRKMLQYVKQENLNRLKTLCGLSNEYVRHLEIKAFRSHIDLTTVLDLLPNLTHLQLSYRVLNAGMSFQLDMCGMKQADAKFLASSLGDASIAPKLVSLNLSENMITDTLLKGILVGLLKNESVTHLDLSHNKIGEEGAIALSAFLKKNQHLQSLNLCDNNIRHNGAMYLAEGLKSNTSLQYLDLKLNRLGDAGGESIFSALLKNHHITFLNVSHNELRGKGLNALLAVVRQQHCSVTHLDLSGNPLPEEAGHELLDAVAVNKSLVYLDCRKCLQTSDVTKLSSMMQKRKIGEE